VKIGVISDTHNFFDPKIPELFAGVDHILHAGDVGTAWIIFQLEQIAPVTAVLGNNDSAMSLKETEIVELDARKFLVHHIINPQSLDRPIARRIMRQRPDVVVFGHTHKRFNEMLGGMLFFNPGYAGRPKFGAARSLAILHCDEKEIRPEFAAL
jgi:putative phosphoesterase